MTFQVFWRTAPSPAMPAYSGAKTVEAESADGAAEKVRRQMWVKAFGDHKLLNPVRVVRIVEVNG